VVVLLAQPKTKDGEKEAVFKAGKGRWSQRKKHLDGDVGGEQSLLGAPPPLPFFFLFWSTVSSSTTAKQIENKLGAPPSWNYSGWSMVKAVAIRAEAWCHWCGVAPASFCRRRRLCKRLVPLRRRRREGVVLLRSCFLLDWVSGLDFLAGRLFFLHGGMVLRYPAMCVCEKGIFWWTVSVDGTSCDVVLSDLRLGESWASQQATVDPLATSL
jgi:hypothetical protein